MILAFPLGPPMRFPQYNKLDPSQKRELFSLAQQPRCITDTEDRSRLGNPMSRSKVGTVQI